MRLLMSKSKPISLVSTNLFRNNRITCLNETGCDVCVGGMNPTRISNKSGMEKSISSDPIEISEKD